MKEWMDRALDLAHQRGAQYSDVRIIENHTQSLAVKEGVTDALSEAENSGFGVRVLAGGAWGFASSAELTQDEVDRVTSLALEIARASATTMGEPVDLGPAVTSQGSYQTPCQVDPFGISLQDKMSLLLRADAEMKRIPALRSRRGNLTFIREHKWFANSEGAFTEQVLIESGGGIQATAVTDGEVQVRSYPSSFGRQQVTAGWEQVLKWDLPDGRFWLKTVGVEPDPPPALLAGVASG